MSLLRRAGLALENRGASPISLGLILFCGAMGYLQAGFYGLWVFGLLVTVFYEFQKRLDQGLPLMQVAALLATLQWTVGPFLSYWLDFTYDRYYMYVGEDEYFHFALPGAAVFSFGLLSVGSSVKLRGLMDAVPRENFLRIGLMLNVVALVARYSAESAPGGLAFALHLVSQLSYVGILYIIYSGHSSRWWLAALCLVPLLRQTAQSAMFHDLLLWVGLLFCYWFSLRKHSGKEKLVLLVVVGFSLFTIQAIKQSYRAKVWKGQEASLIEEITAFWLTGSDTAFSDALPNVVQRLNQGWIISAVLNNVPEREPYAKGETLVDALNAAFVPRFLDPDKVRSGGQVNFRRFTGLDLADSTSMAVSPLGEAYGNFGVEGGIALMLVFGVGFSAFYAGCLRWSLTRPDFIFWIPLIFYQAIKAETEFVTVLNQVSKGAVIAFGGYWALRHQFGPALVGHLAAAKGRAAGARRRKVGFQPGPGAGTKARRPAEQPQLAGTMAAAAVGPVGEAALTPDQGARDPRMPGAGAGMAGRRRGFGG